MIKLSIITINYNNVAGLNATIQSVASQTNKSFEYIVIDGGSTDGSQKVIEENAASIDYWVSEKDRGIYNAMNKGIGYAKGEYLLFLNSGDVLYNENIVAECFNYLQNTSIVYGNVINVKSDGTEWLNRSPSTVSLYSLGYCWSSLPHQAMFIKRDLFEKYGYYDENLKMVSDWAFYLLAIFKHNCSYRHIDKVISYYNFEGFSSNTANEPLQKAEREKVMNDNFSNHHSLMQEVAALKAAVKRYEHSRLIKALKKARVLKS